VKWEGALAGSMTQYRDKRRAVVNAVMNLRNI
jgi:hypothetical protein